MQQVQNEFLGWYEVALKYLTSRFDFSDKNILFKISVMSLRKEIDFNIILKVVHDLKLEMKLDVDELYSEFSMLKESINIAATNKCVENSCLKRWMVILNLLPEEKQINGNFSKLVQFLCSIPPSNDFAERTFSH